MKATVALGDFRDS